MGMNWPFTSTIVDKFNLRA